MNYLFWALFGWGAYELVEKRLPGWAFFPALLTGPIGFVIAMCLRRSVPGWAIVASFVLMCWGLTP